MNVVVTGGGTIAPIDDVRYIANTSTGRFSALITEACLRRGARVWHVYADADQLPFERLAKFDLGPDDPTAEFARLFRLHEEWHALRHRLHRVPVAKRTVDDYARTLHTILSSKPIDVVFLTMAVSDYQPEASAGKISSGAETLTIHAHRTPKVIRSVRDWSPDVYLVGFKLHSGVSEEELVRRGEAACATNRADLTVANDLQLLRTGRHTLHLVRPGQPAETLPPGDDLADRLVDRVFEWAAGRAKDQE